MRKIITICALTLMLGLSSCIRNWVCQCTDNAHNVTNTPISGGTFHHAEHTCHSMSGDCNLQTVER